MAKFTAKFVENVKPGPVRRELPDSGCSGLYLVLQTSGHRSWAVRYRFNGKSIKLTVGKWPTMTLADARKAAADAQAALARGNNPAKAKQTAKVKAMEAAENTVAHICAAYLKRDVSTVQRWEKRESMPVHRHLHDKLGSVYALRSELDAWSHSRNPTQADEQAAGPTLDDTEPAEISTHAGRRRNAWAIAGAAAADSAIAAASVAAKRRANVTG